MTKRLMPLFLVTISHSSTSVEFWWSESHDCSDKKPKSDRFVILAAHVIGKLNTKRSADSSPPTVLHRPTEKVCNERNKGQRNESSDFQLSGRILKERRRKTNKRSLFLLQQASVCRLPLSWSPPCSSSSEWPLGQRVGNRFNRRCTSVKEQNFSHCHTQTCAS